MFLFKGKSIGSDQGLSMALGGGGARGFAHVGVLELLHERGVPVAAIAGTSAGAIAGAGYAFSRDPREMRARVLAFARSPLAVDRRIKAMLEREDEPFSLKSVFRRVDRYLCQGRMFKALFTEPALLAEDYFRQVVEFFLPAWRLEAALIPFTVVCTDLLSGQPAYLERGDMRLAVRASCSVPGISPPVKVDGRVLVDGGAACLVPVEIALEKQGAVVVGVGVERTVEADHAPASALEAYLRAGEIMVGRMGEIMLSQAQVPIKPEVGGYHWLEFTKAGEIMEAGRAAAEAAWPQIQALCDRPGLAKRLFCRGRER